MLNKNKVIIFSALFLLVFFLSGCLGEKQTKVQEQTQDQEYVVAESDFVHSSNLLQNIEKGALNDKEKAGLLQMREEEKLAHDVYTALYEKWGQNVFNNISASEQTHTDSIKTLLDRYGIADPVKSNVTGEFTSPEMKKLYTDLVAKGLQSLGNALNVGATIEDLDIKDLQDLLVSNDNEDIKIVYQNLMKGSRNHMRAFVRQIEKNGGSYSVQYITNQEYQDILNTEQEKGSVNSQGSGLGGGMKNNSSRK